MQSFFHQSREEIQQIVGGPTRAARVFQSVYRHGVEDLPQPLAQSLSLELPSIQERFDSSDGTQRYLLKLADGQTVESVCIPTEGRLTFCVSSQIGCALACTFCLTGQMGLTRDLTAGEIVSQVVLLAREAKGKRFSIVLMGQGEPLQNYENVLKAIGILHDDNGLAVPTSRITLSTAGLVPAMERLAAERVFPNLCISLTGTTNPVRDQLMPINRKYPIDAIMDMVRKLPVSRQNRVMFECVMIKGLTDSEEQAHALAKYLRGMRAKVNLIPLNPAPEIPYERPDDAAVVRYHRILMDAGIATFTRKNRGNDIYGACGQLKKVNA